VTSLKAQDTESFARDVADVAGGLASATEVTAFNEALRELLELVSDCRVLVTAAGDDRLALKVESGEFLVSTSRRQVGAAPSALTLPTS
jgi:hypothetical protein